MAAGLPWEPHAFLWQDGRMTDLGSLGGWSAAYDTDGAGRVVGAANSRDATSMAVSWEGGRAASLGKAAGIEGAAFANDRGEVVGTAGDRGALWRGGGAIDLARAIPNGGGWDGLMVARAINGGAGARLRRTGRRHPGLLAHPSPFGRDPARGRVNVAR